MSHIAHFLEGPVTLVVESMHHCCTDLQNFPKENKFRTGEWPRCRIPGAIISAFKDVDGALAAVTILLTTLATQEDSLFGAEGSNAGYTRVMTALATAFDWGFLTKTKPTHKHWSEFGIAYKMLRPYLIHTEWPPVAEWPAVDRAWPEDVKDLQAQYFLLMSRVRAARSRRGGQRAWHRVEGCFVRAIRAYPSVERLVRQLFRVRVGEGVALTLRVAALISDCLGRSPLSLRLEYFPPHQPCIPFFVSLQSMSICGFRWGARRCLRSAAATRCAVTGH